MLRCCRCCFCLHIAQRLLLLLLLLLLPLLYCCYCCYCCYYDDYDDYDYDDDNDGDCYCDFYCEATDAAAAAAATTTTTTAAATLLHKLLLASSNPHYSCKQLCPPAELQRKRSAFHNQRITEALSNFSPMYKTSFNTHHYCSRNPRNLQFHNLTARNPE